MNPIKFLGGARSNDPSPPITQKRKLIRVSDVMTTRVLTLSPQDSFDDAIELMAKHDYQYVIITDDEKNVVGVISQRDIVGSRWNITEWRTKKVRQAMRPNPVAVTFRTVLVDAISIMISEKVNCLPVTKDNGEFCGILTSMDIMKSHLAVLTIAD
jgi:acetoin utilization protein AcuB